MLSKNGGGSESRFRGDVLDRQAGCLQQLLRPADARTGNPLGRCAHLFEKPSAQRPRAHGRMPRNHGKREPALEIVLDP